jgi:hypothetical protein
MILIIFSSLAYSKKAPAFTAASYESVGGKCPRDIPILSRGAKLIINASLIFLTKV